LKFKPGGGCGLAIGGGGRLREEAEGIGGDTGGGIAGFYI